MRRRVTSLPSATAAVQVVSQAPFPQGAFALHAELPLCHPKEEFRPMPGFWSFLLKASQFAADHRLVSLTTAADGSRA